jgi:alpha/beta superfamily hydrolase
VPHPDLCVVPGAAHFFHGRLGEIDAAVTSFFGSKLGAAANG